MMGDVLVRLLSKGDTLKDVASASEKDDSISNNYDKALNIRCCDQKNNIL